MTNNKQQTAVDWIEQEMLKGNSSLKEILEQAKEMEKEQIIDFGIYIIMEAQATFEGNVTTELTIEEYYNLKYGK